MIKNKIISILKSAKITQKDLANHLGRSRQSVNNKFAKDSFFAKDIIKICDLCGYKLQVVNKEGKVITSFELSDIGESDD